MANTQSSRLLDKDTAHIEGFLGGDAMQCANACLPGGCGKTLHCKSRTIRNSVMEIYSKGKSLLKIPSYLDKAAGDAVQRIGFFYFNGKAGGYSPVKN